MSGGRPADIFMDPKRTVCQWRASTIAADRFSTAVATGGQVLFSRGFGRSGFRARPVSGSHAEEKRPTANPLALMHESRPRARGEILFLGRCCLTPMSDRVFPWKARVVAAAEASGAEVVLRLNLNFQACLYFFSILVETILK